MVKATMVLYRLTDCIIRIKKKNKRYVKWSYGLPYTRIFSVRSLLFLQHKYIITSLLTTSFSIQSYQHQTTVCGINLQLPVPPYLLHLNVHEP